MDTESPLSIDDFLEKLAAGDPEVALDPTVQSGLHRLAAAVAGTEPPKAHLLLVDDSDEDSLFLESALRESGVTMALTRVRDGSDAVEYFRGTGKFTDRGRFPLPQLTILDLKMPGLDGLEALKQIRALPAGARSIIIALTSSTDEADMEKARGLNISAYLTKPETLAALLELVRQVKAAWIDRPLPGDP